jgi:hypothetical protein
MTFTLLDKIRRGLRKPPGYLLERLLQETHGQVERYRAPRRAARVRASDLARMAGHADVSSWWAELAGRQYMAQTVMDRTALEALCPGDVGAILVDAERAVAREVDLLGSGSVNLGKPIDWTKDYKTGLSWPNAYCRDIAYSNLERPSDVKFPWEISRMQWLIPAAQAFALTGEERFAAAVRDVIDEWIEANPYACSVNWACTMDVAIRAMTWTWLFHALHASQAWSDDGFRGRFLRSLWFAGDFTARHLEKSDINGNHYTADAAGLVFTGLFFGGTGEPAAWARQGWDILCEELPRQVYADGVDFEASVPYHRLVQELFLYPALYRSAQGLEISADYRRRLVAMAQFTEAYSRADGSVPLWGDADDARALPFRQKPVNDHRYLPALAGLVFDVPALVEAFSGPRSEVVWLLGPAAAQRLTNRPTGVLSQKSSAFREGGFYVLRNDVDHVFVDCGPLGLAGRGGHGHNDLLSFEAVLDGEHLVSDCGAYLYTASMAERNLFRSTALHNTPRINGEEINRFIRPDFLWLLHNDAAHALEVFEPDQAKDRLVVAHDGYCRLDSPVLVRRTFELDHASHSLLIADELYGSGEHAVEIPLHLAIGVRAELTAGGAILISRGRRFLVTFTSPAPWGLTIEPARVSPTYGVAVPTLKLLFQRTGLLAPLRLELRPA